MKFCHLQRKSCVRVYAPGQTFVGSNRLSVLGFMQKNFWIFGRFLLPAKVHAELKVLRDKVELLKAEGKGQVGDV